MSNSIQSIYRYPIKGLSGERLDKVDLIANEVIAGDREYAFARAGVDFNPDHPQYMQKTNFLALVRDQKLASLKTKYNTVSKRLSFYKHGAVLIDVSLTSPIDCQRIGAFLGNYLDMSPHKLPRIVRATHGTKKHSFSDVPDKAISIINLSSIMEFSKQIGIEIDPMRFRANINFKNNIPWQEFDWVNKKIRIGDAILNIFKRTQRCAATDVNPFSAIRDVNIIKELNRHYHHLDMGVYATVIKSGTIKFGDKIKLL